jgi:hypothetical protein
MWTGINFNVTHSGAHLHATFLGQRPQRVRRLRMPDIESSRDPSDQSSEWHRVSVRYGRVDVLVVLQQSGAVAATGAQQHLFEPEPDRLDDSPWCEELAPDLIAIVDLTLEQVDRQACWREHGGESGTR